MSGEIGGLVLAVRTDARNGQLRAFLAHHLPWCEGAVVLLSRREGESAEEVPGVVGEFGERVRLVDFPRRQFNNGETCRALSAAVGETEAKVILHLDKDEFLARPSKLAEMVERISTGETDYAEGRMVCRFAPEGWPYPEELPDYAAFCRAAPVRAHILRAYGFPDVKCYLCRSPEVRMHDSRKGWKKDPQGMVLDHFRWTEKGRERSLAKSGQHSPGLAGKIRWRDRNVYDRTEDFLRKLGRNIRELGCGEPDE